MVMISFLVNICKMYWVTIDRLLGPKVDNLKIGFFFQILGQLINHLINHLYTV